MHSLLIPVGVGTTVQPQPSTHRRPAPTAWSRAEHGWSPPARAAGHPATAAGCAGTPTPPHVTWLPAELRQRWQKAGSRAEAAAAAGGQPEGSWARCSAVCSTLWLLHSRGQPKRRRRALHLQLFLNSSCRGWVECLKSAQQVIQTAVECCGRTDSLPFELPPVHLAHAAAGLACRRHRG